MPEILTALDVIEEVYAKFKHDCVVTSGRGDKHSARFSRHYFGGAVDIRTRQLTLATRRKIQGLLKERLGPDYNIIYETRPVHFHIGYKPKYHA